MLSVTADHALRAVLFLGREHARCPLPAEEIAGAIGAPANYLSKTLNTLAKAGVLASVAGRQGGFSLAVPPYRLTLARIVTVFDQPSPPGRCLLGDRPCDPVTPCSAHRRWTAISHSYLGALQTTTIADLLGESPPYRRLLNARSIR